MNIKDIHDYFGQENRRNLSPEEVAALFAYLLVTEGNITAQNVLDAATSGGYYNISKTVLYRVIRFFEGGKFCKSTFNRREIGKGKKGAGRPEKSYSLPDDLRARRVVYSMISYWPKMPGNQCSTVKRRRLKRFIANYEAFPTLSRPVDAVSR